MDKTVSFTEVLALIRVKLNTFIHPQICISRINTTIHPLLVKIFIWTTLSIPTQKIKSIYKSELPDALKALAIVLDRFLLSLHFLARFLNI